MANPIWSWLRGDDYKTTGAIEQASRAPAEQKFGFTPSSAQVDWQYVNHLVYTADPALYRGLASGDFNSAVFACLSALATGSIEPPLKVFRKDRKGKLNPIDAPLQEFLDDPNPWLEMDELRFWIAWNKHLDGNAYLLKERSGNALTGNVIRLWPVSPTLMRPWTEKDSQEFIDYYRLEVAPGVYEEVPPENVLHFRMGIDDRDTRRGLSPLKRLAREIETDSEATNFSDALLKNFGIPGLVVTTPGDTPMSREQAEALKIRVAESFGSNSRGNVGVLSPGSDMKQFGFNPEQLNLEGLHHGPEARICAVMGVHPAVAMLAVGLEQTANYASLRAVYEAFTERKLVPMWKMDERKWNKRLRPDFSQDKSIIIAHDLTEVRALQEDMDALYARLDMAVQHGWILKDEAREEVGRPPLPDGLGAVPTAAPAPAPLGQGQDGQDNEPPPQNGKAFSSTQIDLERWPELMEGLRALAEPAFTDEVTRHFDDERRRTKRALMSS